MREIKFRAWDNGEMHQVSFNNLSVNFFNPSGSIYIREEMKPFGKSHTTKLMQFTGIYDCKGKEIYEGDIITVDLFSGEFGDRKGEVIFENGGILVRLDYTPPNDGTHLNKPLTPFLYKLRRNNSIGEVIGNIYENPELLEGDEGDTE